MSDEHAALPADANVEAAQRFRQVVAMPAARVERLQNALQHSGVRGDLQGRRFTLKRGGAGG